MTATRQGDAVLAGVKAFCIKDFRLESGVVMPAVTIAYRTLGALATNRDNAVLITHGNTSGPQMIDPDGSTGEGSWKDLVGPGKPVDTNRFFVICPNMLGSSYGSTNAASIDPATGRPYGPRFPDITVSDIVATQRALLGHFGIDRLVAIVGPSYGGFQAFQWAVNYPGMMKGIAAVVTSPVVPRERSAGNIERLLTTLSKDPNWNGGDYYDRGGVFETMIQIRSATLKTYGIEARLRSTMPDAEQIEAAIRDEAARWARGFDANSLIILARALRGFDVTPRFGDIKAKVLYVLSRTDRLFPPELAPGVMQALQNAGVEADYFLLDSEYGHSASGIDAPKWAPRLRLFMEQLSQSQG
ncbi:alpha/beta fold hydrolase [Bradyrhizobium canariense]|uniref:Probable acyltransferase n=1 Tax=Bradyrhizobium canariense TaxID=255045 RepID=A0A1H1ZXE9_9BRAD|nr:alpha/beta fold hydrolase [Bradyrhizobium canariense]SDT38072.1 homoserine O-acetyltransferase [Bradyrhizobium canariense]